MRGFAQSVCPLACPSDFYFLALAEFFRISALERFFSSWLALAYTDFLQGFLKYLNHSLSAVCNPALSHFFVSPCYFLVYLYPFLVYVYYLFVLVYYLFIPLSFRLFCFVISCLPFCVARLFFCVS